MANIGNDVDAIRAAKIGEQVRENIAHAIEEINDEVNVGNNTAEMWATGGTGGTPTAENNAKKYAEDAQAIYDSIPPDYTIMTNRVLDLYPQKQATGNPAVVIGGDIESNLSLVKLEVPFTGSQDGTGEPSESNYRPFSLPSDFTVHADTENIYGGAAMREDFRRYLADAITAGNASITEAGNIIFRGAATSDVSSLRPPCIGSEKIQFDANTRYTIMLSMRNNGDKSNMSYYYVEGSERKSIVGVTSEKNVVITKTDPQKTLRDLTVWNNTSNQTTLYPGESGIFKGDKSVEDYVPYRAPIDIDMPDSGTAYAGNVDVVSGKIYAKKRLITLTSDMDWNVSGTSSTPDENRYFYVVLGAKGAVKTGCICSTLPTKAMSSQTTDEGIYVYNSNNVPDSSGGAILAARVTSCNGNLASFKNWLDNMAQGVEPMPVQVVYEVTSPDEYDGTPNSITVYRGENRFWTSNGSDTITATYYGTPPDLEKEKADKRTINILSVGSSQTQSNWGYVPEILRRIAPDIEFNFGNLYRSGTENWEYAAHPNDTTWSGYATEYNEWNSDAAKWTKYSGTYSLNDVLARKKWDIVYGHVTLNSSGTDYVDDPTNIKPERNFTLMRTKCRQFRDLVVAAGNTRFRYVTGSYISSASASGYGQETSVAMSKFYHDLVASGAFEDYIPIGEALQNARSKLEARRLGVVGLMRFNMSSSGYGSGHLQNGLPVLVSSYAIAAKILQWCDYDYRGIIGSEWVPTTAEVARIGCITVNTETGSVSLKMTHGQSHFMAGVTTGASSDVEADAAIAESALTSDLPFAQDCVIRAMEGQGGYKDWDASIRAEIPFEILCDVYNSNKAYNPGEYCMLRGALWKATALTIPDYDASATYTDDDRFIVGGAVMKLVPIYSTDAIYEITDCCVYDGNLYYCTKNVTIGEEFDSSKWKRFVDYVAADTYQPGDVCINGGNCYFCNDKNVTGTFDFSHFTNLGGYLYSKWMHFSKQPFDPAKWQETTVMDEVLSLASRIAALET